MKWKNIKTLSIFRRAQALNKKRKKYIKRGLQPRHGGGRVSAIISDDLGQVRFDLYAAPKTGLSARSIQRLMTDYRGICKKARKNIMGTWAEDNGVALTYLRKLPEHEQIRLSKELKNHPTIRPLSRLHKEQLIR